MIGTVVGNYKVVQKIGEGGMGAVYKGVDLMLEREVAIKVLKPELASQPQVVERFRSEAVTLAKLNNPNIATLYNFFRQGDNFFMVLEFVDGTALDKIIEAHGVMTCEQAIPLFCQMLEGIDHAHSFGIVHRDIKPANMMLTQNGLLKVLDFGIARALGSARMTRAGHLIGTIEYMSPEQVRGMETDARSDIYSLGMVLYEMLTGRVPFASDSEFELMKAQVEQLPTPPRVFAPSIPEQVEWAILCATEKDPEKRFQTAGAFGEAIIDSVTTAMASGELSQIDMRGSTSRLSAAVGGRERFTSRVSGNSAPGYPQVASASGETAATSLANESLPPPTRFVSPDNGPLSAANALKPTRLGNALESSLPGVMASPVSAATVQPTSFFSKLSAKHIMASAVAAVLILGLLVIAAALISRGGKGNPEEASAPNPPSNRQLTTSTSRETGAQDSRPEPPNVNASQPVQSVEERRVEAPESNPALVAPSETPKPNKPARASAPARPKSRRSSRDIMGVP